VIEGTRGFVPATAAEMMSIAQLLLGDTSIEALVIG